MRVCLCVCYAMRVVYVCCPWYVRIVRCVCRYVMYVMCVLCNNVCAYVVQVIYFALFLNFVMRECMYI